MEKLTQYQYQKAELSSIVMTHIQILALSGITLSLLFLYRLGHQQTSRNSYMKFLTSVLSQSYILCSSEASSPLVVPIATGRPPTDFGDQSVSKGVTPACYPTAASPDTQ